MKKNIMMRLAAVLFILVLLTTCGISSAYAKYTTSGNAGDNAQVAKWGVKVSVAGEKAFDITDANVKSADAEISVIAPGTNGKLGSLSITGTPEVATAVKVSLNVDLTGWVISVPDTANPGSSIEIFYCPLVFKSGSTEIIGATYSQQSDLEEAIEALLANNGSVVKYDPNTDLSTNVTAVDIEWEWKFQAPDATYGNDLYDTLLADKAEAPKINVEFVAEVNQEN